MPKTWKAEPVLEMARGYQTACVLAAAVDLEIFTVLPGRGLRASELADKLAADLRGLTILLDALTALELIEKQDDRYSVPPSLVPWLSTGGPGSVLAMVQHQANIMRRWVQLPSVVKTGRPAERVPSIRGEAADHAAFIGAMHDIGGPVADQIVADLGPVAFRHLLDVGGASGTWTISFLKACPEAKATLFDLPHVIPMASRRLAEAGYAERVSFVAGDFMRDPLPSGADLAWVSAIVHQNSREQNRQLFGKICQALNHGGRIAVRDILMDPTRTRPAAGALFAVNMLVGTEGGGTFTFEELREDLEASGFNDVTLARRDEEWMHSVLTATRP